MWSTRASGFQGRDRPADAMPMIRQKSRASLWLGIAALPTLVAGSAADSAVLLVLSAALYTGAIVAYLVAKGRSVAWTFLGICPLFGWLIIAGLSDHSHSDKGSESPKRRVRRQDHRRLRTFTSLIYPIASLLWILAVFRQWMDVAGGPNPLVVSLVLLRAGCLCALGYAIHRSQRGGAIAAAVAFLLASACESVAQGNAADVIMLQVMLPVFALLLSLGVFAAFTEPPGTHDGEPVPEPVSHGPSTLRRRIRRYVAIPAVVICVGFGFGTLALIHGDFKLFHARTVARRLVEPLEQYRETHGRYPEDLKALAEARAIEDGSLRRIHYELHDGGDAFFMSCRMGADQHQWDVFDSRIGRWETR